MTHGNDGKRNAAKPAGERADAHLHIRVKADDLLAWKRRASREGAIFTPWVIKQLNAKS